MCNIKYDTNEPLYKTETESGTQSTDWWLPRGCGEGMDWEHEISRYKLAYTEWINNKVPLYSTSKYIQHPMINHNEKECVYRYIYTHTHIYVQLTHFAFQQ